MSTITVCRGAEIDAYNRNYGSRLTLFASKSVQSSVISVTPSLERRVTSLVADSLIFTACCGVLLLWYVGGTLATVPTWMGRTAGAVLLLMLVLEGLTGLTPGRLLTHLRLGGEDGARMPLATLLARTGVKWVPIALFVFGLWSSSPLADLFWWADAILVQFYATLYYFAVARRDRSAFDLPVKTRIVLAQA